jgi:hypothetical protein
VVVAVAVVAAAVAVAAKPMHHANRSYQRGLAAASISA